MVDAIILAVLAAAVWMGYQKGLVRSLVGLVGNIMALLLAYTLANPVALWISAKFGIIPVIADKIQGLLPMPEGFDLTIANLDGVAALYSYLDKSFLPKVVRQNIIQAVQEQVHTLGQGVFMTMAETVADVIAQSLWQGLVFFLLWLLLGLVILKGSRLIMGMVHRIPLIGKIDRLGGALVSLLLVGLTLAVFYNALGLFVQIGTQEQGSWLQPVAQSRLLPALQAVLQGIIGR